MKLNDLVLLTRREKPYAYGLTFSTLGVGGTQTRTIQINGNTRFKLERIGMACFQTADLVATARPPLALQVTDTASQTNLFSDFTTLHMAAASALSGGAMRFQEDRLFMENSTITVQIRNDGALAYDTVQISLLGTSFLLG